MGHNVLQIDCGRRGECKFDSEYLAFLVERAKSGWNVWAEESADAGKPYPLSILQRGELGALGVCAPEEGPPPRLIFLLLQ